MLYIAGLYIGFDNGRVTNRIIGWQKYQVQSPFKSISSDIKSAVMNNDTQINI